MIGQIYRVEEGQRAHAQILNRPNLFFERSSTRHSQGTGSCATKGQTLCCVPAIQIQVPSDPLAGYQLEIRTSKLLHGVHEKRAVTDRAYRDV